MRTQGTERLRNLSEITYLGSGETQLKPRPSRPVPLATLLLPLITLMTHSEHKGPAACLGEGCGDEMGGVQDVGGGQE